MSQDERPVYRVRRVRTAPEFRGLWDGPAWGEAETARIRHYRPEGSDHRPLALAKALYDDEALYIHFRVEEDRFVRAVHTAFNSAVWCDSCAECFVQPSPEGGYFNLEMNCGGTLLTYYVEDPTEVDGDMRTYSELPETLLETVRVYHSLPERVEPELPGPVTWQLEYAVPRALLEACTGPLGSWAGQTWRGNFYKCGDETSHPHWGAWSPVSAVNFHVPEEFGLFRFEE